MNSGKYTELVLFAAAVFGAAYTASAGYFSAKTRRRVHEESVRHEVRKNPYAYL